MRNFPYLPESVDLSLAGPRLIRINHSRQEGQGDDDYNLYVLFHDAPQLSLVFYRYHTKGLSRWNSVLSYMRNQHPVVLLLHWLSQRIDCTLRF